MSPVLDRKAVAAHVLVALSVAAEEGRSVTVADVAETIKVRRGDVREVVSQLHAEGHVDALRMRLSMTGLALARNLAKSTLKKARNVEAAKKVAKASEGRPEATRAFKVARITAA